MRAGAVPCSVRGKQHTVCDMYACISMKLLLRLISRGSSQLSFSPLLTLQPTQLRHSDSTFHWAWSVRSRGNIRCFCLATHVEKLSWTSPSQLLCQCRNNCRDFYTGPPGKPSVRSRRNIRCFCLATHVEQLSWPSSFTVTLPVSQQLQRLLYLTVSKLLPP
jgi:hypothetical protein